MSARDNLIRVYEYALNQEQTGMGFFQASLVRLQLGSAISAFKKLIKEEEKHIQFISRIIDDLKTKGELDYKTIREVTLEPTNYFDARSTSEFLDKCVMESMIPDVTVFNTAWLIEKDLSEFYAKAAAQSEGAAGDAFRMLSAWEKGHEEFFREFRDKLTATYSQMPWGG